jgi:hypothetical protein
MERIDLGTDDPRVIALAARGKITGEAMAALVDRLEEIRATSQRALIYIDLTEYDGWEAAVVKEKLGHLGTLWHGIERLAYVVDKSWMAKMMPLVDAVTPMHVRAFGPDEADAAREWVLTGGGEQ